VGKGEKGEVCTESVIEILLGGQEKVSNGAFLEKNSE